MNGVVVVFAVVVILVVVLLVKGVRIVRQSEAIIIERLGKYQKTLTSVRPIFDL